MTLRLDDVGPFYEVLGMTWIIRGWEPRERTFTYGATIFAGGVIALEGTHWLFAKVMGVETDDMKLLEEAQRYNYKTGLAAEAIVGLASGELTTQAARTAVNTSFTTLNIGVRSGVQTTEESIQSGVQISENVLTQEAANAVKQEIATAARQGLTTSAREGAEVAVRESVPTAVTRLRANNVKGSVFEAVAKKAAAETGETVIESQFQRGAAVRGFDFLSVQGTGADAQLFINEVKDEIGRVGSRRFTTFGLGKSGKAPFDEAFKVARDRILADPRFDRVTRQTLLGQLENRTAKIRLIGGAATRFDPDIMNRIGQATGFSVEEGHLLQLK